MCTAKRICVDCNVPLVRARASFRAVCVAAARVETHGHPGGPATLAHLKPYASAATGANRLVGAAKPQRRNHCGQV
jgi:hypothetical protein